MRSTPRSWRGWRPRDGGSGSDQIRPPSLRILRILRIGRPRRRRGALDRETGVDVEGGACRAARADAFRVWSAPDVAVAGQHGQGRIERLDPAEVALQRLVEIPLAGRSPAALAEPGEQVLGVVVERVLAHRVVGGAGVLDEVAG